MTRFLLALLVIAASSAPGCYPGAPDVQQERCYPGEMTKVEECLPANKAVVGPLLSEDSHFKSVDSGPVLKVAGVGQECCYEFTLSSGDGGLQPQSDCLSPTFAQEDAGVCPDKGEALARLNAKYHDTVVSVDSAGTLKPWVAYKCCYQVTFKTDPP